MRPIKFIKNYKKETKKKYTYKYIDKTSKKTSYPEVPIPHYLRIQKGRIPNMRVNQEGLVRHTAPAQKNESTDPLISNSSQKLGFLGTAKWPLL